MNPLASDQLYQACDPAALPFETTADLNNGNQIVGQQRALEAIRFGVGIGHEGFNLYVQGPHGVGKETAVKQYLSQIAPTAPTPDDWCYVYNFAQPHKPEALQFPPGKAVLFRNEMKQLIEALLDLIPATFSGEEYQNQKKAIESTVKAEQEAALNGLRDRARAQGMAFLTTPAGFAFAPLDDGQVISPDAFMKLGPEEQKAIEAKIVTLQEELQRIMRQMPHWQRDLQQRIRQLNEEAASFAISPLFEELRQKYAFSEEVLTYLEAVQKDVLVNLGDFLGDGKEGVLPTLMGGVASNPSGQAPVTRYQVNVIVDHSDMEGAPVVFADQPRYDNLVGRIEHIQQMGALLTDFTLIKSGKLHEANGGYLVVDVRKLLQQPFAWEGLKQALRTQEIRIESLGQMYSFVSTVSLDPEPIPLNVKVVLLGERLLYYLLCQYDPDFTELFKVTADFADQIDRDETNTTAYARLIAVLARKEGLRHFDRGAVARVIEQGARLAGDASKLTTHMQTVTDLLREADFWAGEIGEEVVTAVSVQKALDAQVYRLGRIRERIQESIVRDTILIDTDGVKVGQINGLSVLSLGDQMFGKPSRITARVRLGKGEVIDIERQVEMGGPLHSKGVLILSSFLGSRYAQDKPFSLSASLVFEQSYGGVDGDSASSAELYALLSAIADVPLKQSLAVTGSVNQHGEVQAIGGVNEKIEGFFDLCQARGLTGTQGVLIPQANVKHLMLRQDVVEAATAGKFHIYPIATIDQGIELLTDVAAGELDAQGTYPVESINGRVVARLAALAEQQRAFIVPNGKKEAAEVS